VIVARARTGERVFHAEVEDSELRVLSGDIFGRPERTGETVALADVALLSPIDPGTIYIILGGFLTADDSQRTPDATPQVAVKRVSVVGGEGAEIVVPSFVSRSLWAEVELAVIVGESVHNVSPEDAEAAIWGFTCFNDVTAAEFIWDLDAQRPLRRPDWFRSKSIDTFATMGPWVRTDLAEADVEAGLELTARVNGVRKAGGNTSRFKVSVGEVVRFVARQTTLRAGDVIALGTPQPAEMGPGDEVEVEVEGIGVLRNRVVEAGDGR
jgi:2-keto-4-pentenoate hydratase/2-oxohepta-3-ene-1,7-dioic acid hydratase in catechol pathway